MKKATAQDVKQYYNTWATEYDKAYGNIIQAFRPKGDKELMEYIIQSSKLKKGANILDAGCGVAGPAVYFAQLAGVKVSGITISDVQAVKAQENIAAAKQQKNVEVICGNYHHLTEYYKPDTFDAAYFLESLGHSENTAQAMAETYKVLKPGGFVYIKDFFPKLSTNTAEQERINTAISNINKHYTYNTLDLNETLNALRITGFEIEFIKRFDFNDNTSVRAKFETQNNINIFEGTNGEFTPAEWLEIKCFKPGPTGIKKWFQF